jgi:hypothetical protein
LVLLNWNTQQLGRKVDLLLNSRLSVENWLEFEIDTKDKFVAPYSKFGSKAAVCPSPSFSFFVVDLVES